MRTLFLASLGFLSFFSTSIYANDLWVEVVPANELVIYPESRSVMTVLSEHQATLRSEVASQLESMLIEEGQALQQGDDIAHFVCLREDYEVRALSAQFETVQSQLDFAAWQRKQNKSLTEQSLSSVEAHKRFETDAIVLQHQVKEVAARYEQAQNQLKKCRIRAPFEGVVTQRYLRTGDFASPGQAIVDIVDVDNVYGLAEVPPYSVDELTQAAVIRFETKERLYEAQLQRAIPVVNSNTGLQTVRFSFALAQPMPGARGTLVWRSPIPHLPHELLRQRDGQLGYFVLREGHTVTFVPLADALEGRPAPMTDLSDRIITTQLNRLNAGDTVQVLSYELD